MSKILILNASKVFGHSYGKLNDYLTDVASQVLEKLGHDVKITRIDDGYTVDEEVEKIIWADAIIYQMPAWWMSGPWTIKKYIDDVFTAGHGKIYQSDGRTRSDRAKHYGSGGLCQGKHYMFSMTWNAPLQAFTDPEQFFEGRGIDGVLFPFHKANQFVGMSPLPTFMCNDVMKAPETDKDVDRYTTHLKTVFPPVK